MGRCHRSCSTPQSLPPSANFYSIAGGDQKKLRNRGGFQAAFPLYQMNRHKQPTPEKSKQKSNLKQEKQCKLNNQ